ncbi:zf-HC2 domain-containing protein [Streptomyces sp. NPDC007100]|uniref:zf-HC2 domain-containing protein n=1 Tax=Streptomyces sp. NPDC007100 TaxID=3155602 RepID=UPI003411574A
MQCSRVRTALSARLDGEQLPPGVTDGRLDAHLAACADCRRWSEQAARLRRLTSAAREAAEATDRSAPDDPALDGLLGRLRRDGAPGDGRQV